MRWVDLFFISETTTQEEIKRTPCLSTNFYERILFKVSCSQPVLLMIEQDSRPDMQRAEEIIWHPIMRHRGVYLYRKIWGTKPFVRGAIKAPAGTVLNIVVKGRPCEY